jgi:hypothetical protein
MDAPVGCLPRKYFQCGFCCQVREMEHVSGWGGGGGGEALEWTSVVGVLWLTEGWAVGVGYDQFRPMCCSFEIAELPAMS